MADTKVLVSDVGSSALKERAFTPGDMSSDAPPTQLDIKSKPLERISAAEIPKASW